MVLEDLPHRRRRDGVAEADEFAVDTPVAPGRVLGIETEDQSTKLGWCGWSTGSGLWWLGPVAGDEATVPAEHGGGLHDQHHIVEPGPVERT